MRFAVLLCLGAACVWAQHEKDGEKSRHPFIGDRKAIDAGHKLFANSCGACHGAEGQGGRGPNLRDRVMWHPLDDDTLYTAIQKGIPGAMPGANLPEDQAWRIVAFVRSLTAPAAENDVPGDQAAGEKVFWGSAGCSNCHQIQGRGGRLGPDLTDIGGSRALPQIRQAIVNPDENGSAGYRAVQVTLANGQVLKGVARNFSNYSLQLQDAKGELHLLSMKDLKDVSLSHGSPMPKDYAKRLSADDIQNLLAYLAHQTVRPVEQAKK